MAAGNNTALEVMIIYALKEGKVKFQRKRKTSFNGKVKEFPL